MYGGQQTERGKELWTYTKQNFAKIAEDIGALGIRVEKSADIGPALQRAPEGRPHRKGKIAPSVGPAHRSSEGQTDYVMSHAVAPAQPRTVMARCGSRTSSDDASPPACFACSR
jgi:hypothetical protein